MIVCVCHAVTERLVRELAGRGLSPDEVALATRAGTACGCCGEAVARLVAAASPCRASPCTDCPAARAA